MAYTDYTPDQINTYFAQHKIGDDPWAWYNHAVQNNADPLKVAAARGVGADQAQAWLSSNVPALKNQIAGQAQLAQTNPHQAFAASQARGYSPAEAERIFGAGTGVASPWAASQGLTWGAAPAAAPAPSTAGSTPAPMPAGGPGNGTVGTPDYMVAAPSGQPHNPYLPSVTQPAGGPSLGRDPRVGGPMNWGGMRPAMGGLMGYLSQNPHMLAMGNEVTRGVTNALTRNVLPQIRRNAMVDGVSGGSGQEIAEGLAIGESMSGLAGALSRLYGDQFERDRGFGLQNDALDFQIHRGNLQDMRAGQLDTLDFLDRMGNWNQQGIGAATTVQNAPLTYWNSFVGPASQMAGLGGSSTQSLSGNPFLGAMGGWMAGSRMFGG